MSEPLEEEEDLSYSCGSCGVMLDDPVSGAEHEDDCDEQLEEDNDE